MRSVLRDFEFSPEVPSGNSAPAARCGRCGRRSEGGEPAGKGGDTSYIARGTLTAPSAPRNCHGSARSADAMPKKYTLKQSSPGCELGECRARPPRRARRPCGVVLLLGRLSPKDPGIWGIM